MQARRPDAYGVQAGGRRLRALQMLVKQKKLAKNAPVPCIVRSGGFVEADSLAENTEREALHPIDQFRAFAALRDKGQGEDTIAAAFGVTPAVVKQRLRLANASPLLLKAYEDDADCRSNSSWPSASLRTGSARKKSGFPSRAIGTAARTPYGAC